MLQLGTRGPGKAGPGAIFAVLTERGVVQPRGDRTMKRRMLLAVWMLLAVSEGCLFILSGCYTLRASSGGGQTSFHPPGRFGRRTSPSRSAIALSLSPGT